MNVAVFAVTRDTLSNLSTSNNIDNKLRTDYPSSSIHLSSFVGLFAGSESEQNIIFF